MNAARPSAIWIGTLAAVVVIIVLLRDILLPFVAGIALAYLLDPVVERIERLGVNRTVAALGIVGLFIIGVGGAEGRRRRCDLWGFENRWRLLSSGRNDYQR